MWLKFILSKQTNNMMNDMNDKELLEEWTI